jgi:hypothetical protein
MDFYVKRACFNVDLSGISWAEMLFGVTSQGPTRDV